MRSTEEIRKEHLEKDPAFREYWERTALARAVALAVIGYRVKHHLSQTQLARQLGVQQPQVARLELGEHTPSLGTLQRLAGKLNLRFIVEVTPANQGDPSLTIPDGMEVVEDVSANGSRIRVVSG